MLDGEPEATTEGPRSIERRALSSVRQVRIVIIVAMLLAAVLASLWWAGRWSHEQAGAAAEARTPPGTFRATAQQLKTFTVETVVTHAFVSEERAEGKIAVNADRATQVFSPYSGRVTRVIAGLGDTVKAGASLATLEASEFVQAQNDLRNAAAQMKIARSNETRKHALFEAKGGSLQDWQQAQAELSSAETTFAAARNRLKIFGQSDTAIASLESAHAMDASANLIAPLAGVVVDRQVGPGQYLQAGSGTPVFTIADPSSVWLLANVREEDAGLVQVGQVVEVQVLAYPKRTFTARVRYVAALIDPLTHRLTVRADIDNQDGSLKPEMFASFRILTSDASSSPAVPESAVVYEGELAHVWVLAGEGLITYRAIHIGRSGDGLVEVLDGIAVGERVVTKGGLFIDQVVSPAAS